MSTLALNGGEWTMRGLVRVWLPKPERIDVERLDLPLLPQRTITDVHELFACLTCHCRVDEPCKNSGGGNAKRAHAGRLTPRLCRCGASLKGYGNARMCAGCAYESHRESQRVSAQRRRAA